MTRKEKYDIITNQVYDFIVSFVKEKGHSPLVIDITKALGIYYTTVEKRIVDLKKSGLIVKGQKFDMVRALPKENIYDIGLAQKKVIYFSVKEQHNVGVDVPKLPLTPTEKKVYDFVLDFHKNNNTFPHFADIQKHFGFKSRISSHKFIKQLADKNHIIRGRDNLLVENIL